MNITSMLVRILDAGTMRGPWWGFTGWRLRRVVGLSSLAFWVQGSGFRGLGFGVQGFYALGFRIFGV